MVSRSFLVLVSMLKFPHLIIEHGRREDFTACVISFLSRESDYCAQSVLLDELQGEGIFGSGIGVVRTNLWTEFTFIFRTAANMQRVIEQRFEKVAETVGAVYLESEMIQREGIKWQGWVRFARHPSLEPVPEELSNRAEQVEKMMRHITGKTA